jgi:hypothetical protein
MANKPVCNSMDSLFDPKTNNKDPLCIRCLEDLIQCEICMGYFFLSKFEENHGENCLFLKYEDDYVNCDFCFVSVNKEELSHHLDICEEKKIHSSECKFCKKSFHLNLLEEHEKSCESIQFQLSIMNEKVKCEFCKEMVNIQHLELHEKHCMMIQVQNKYIEDKANEVLSYPEDWVFLSEENDTKWKLFPVNQYDINSKYKFIEDILNKTGPSIMIKNVWRMQNKGLWESYYYEKLKLNKEKKKIAQESWLWYGCHIFNYEKYFQLGFDIALFHQYGEAGKAIYFYKYPEYIIKYKSLFEKDGSKYLVLCKVLTGVPFVEKRGFIHKKTPFLDEKKLIYYDSITNVADYDYLESWQDIIEDRIDFNKFYCIYDNNKAYPLYLIEML